MRKYISLLFILFVFGCAHKPKQVVLLPDAAKPLANAKDLENKPLRILNQHEWMAKGRLAVSQGNKGGNAQFTWQQKGDSFRIKLFGPFGQGAVVLSGRSQQVELKESNGKVTRAGSPEQLLKKVAGWQVPVSGLRYWLRGAPSPEGEISQQQHNPQGLLTSIQQQGWRIHIENYHASGLPHKLNLQNGNLKIKMIVTSWEA